MRRRTAVQRDVTEVARRTVDKTIEELISLGEQDFDHLSFHVRMEWGPGGALVAHLEPKTGAARSLLTGAVARATA
jgi:hypothetical protein